MSEGAPHALREVRAARQIPGENRRRWFTSDDADLFVWVDDEGANSAFQFCFDKQRPGGERALTWRPKMGFVHEIIDAGDWTGGMKGTPIFVTSTQWSVVGVLLRFRSVSGELPEDVRGFVDAVLSAAVRRPRSQRRRRHPALPEL